MKIHVVHICFARRKVTFQGRTYLPRHQV